MLQQTAHDDRAPSRLELRRLRLRSRERFQKSQRAAEGYARQLRGVSSQIGKIIRGFAPKGWVSDPHPIMNALQRYSELLGPWAESVAARMTAEVAQRDEKAWNEMGRELGRGLAKEIRTAPVGEVYKRLMQEQVKLIKSLPTDAARRVHELTLEAMTGGDRAKEVAKMIMRSGQVSKSHATLIARTEAARSSSALTQARATHIGALGYIWRTAHDSDVRPLHKKLEGVYVLYSDPPIAGEDGERAHAGMIYNCRCWQEPVIPDDL